MVSLQARCRRRSIRAVNGFSMLEMLFVVAILATTASIAIPVSRDFLTSVRADSASRIAVSALQEARERAIAERRNIQVNFVLPNRIRIERMEVPGPGVTLLSQVELEGLQSFRLVPDVPDTPDAFGRTGALSFTGKTPVMFTSDGSFIDADGDVVNGSIFLAGTGPGDSVRAITIFGVTGLIRTWKWTGREWVE